ncbi:hypothetical protein [Caulobacter sp. LjRoot300]
MDDDSGRTAARMDYLRRDIRPRLKLMAAARAAREAERAGGDDRAEGEA